MIYLTLLPIQLSALVCGFSRGFFLPRPGPGLFPGTKKRNETDAIVIENTDGDNGTIRPLLPSRFPITPPSTCPKERSCLGRCSTARQFQNITSKEKSLRCFCDPECNTVFHDCCADYEKYCQETENQRTVVRWGCGKIVGQDFGIWTIDKCTQDWPHDEVRSKCENNSTEIDLKDTPVLIVDELRNIFRNRHCARCNNVQKFTCFTLGRNNSHSRLPTKDVNKDSSLLEECPQISLNRSYEVGFRYCYEIQSSCKYLQNSTTVRICRDGKTGLVTFKDQTYKNFHCLKCNRLFSFGFFPAKVSCGPYFGPGPRFNFAAMFRLPASLHTGSRCSPGFLYDNIARTCRKLLTVSELNLNNSSFLTKYAIRLHYKRNQKLNCFGYSVHNKNSKEIKNVTFNKLLNGLRNAFMRKIQLNLKNTNWTISDIAVDVENTSYITVSFLILAIKHEINATKLFSPVKDLNLGMLRFYYDLLNAFSLCSYGLIEKFSRIRRMTCLDQNQSNVITMDKVSIFDNGTLSHEDTRNIFSLGEYMVYKRHNQTRLAVCKNTIPTDCKYILKSDSNWKLYSNRSVYSSLTNMWFEFGEYSIIDGVVWMCLTDELSLKSAKEEQFKTIHELVLRYSTLCCFSVSILALILLVFIYAITPSLRNLPGKNLMLLCCVLALAQFLWLLQEQAFQFPSVCIALSILLHFLFLASFTCSTSIALLSFLTFRAIAKGKLGHSNDEKAFFRYTLFSLGIPSVWLSLFLLLDYSGIILLDYGSVKGHCWLANMQGLYVSFFAPVFTLLFVNLALLLATVNMIRKCAQATQKLAESTKSSLKRNNVWIYIRMASLMGFTWLLGIFQIIFPRVLVFEYLFVFVNGLQGFYIALSFLFTDNVKKILSKRIGGSTSSTSK